MRTLQIHAKRFSYKIREKALDNAEDEGFGEGASAENALVVFTTIERGDGEAEVEEVAREICSHASRVKASTIVIYPYAHLSSNLESPNRSIQLLKELFERTQRCASSVMRAPFGWYKEFLIEAYGHPLAELSRSFERKRGKEALRLSRKIHEKLVNDYFRRFGLDISREFAKFREPWSQIIMERVTPSHFMCTASSLDEAAKHCEGGGNIKLSILPGGESLVDFFLHSHGSPCRRDFRKLKLEESGGIIIAEYGEEISIPVGIQTEQEKYMLLNSFIVSLIADRLIALEEGLEDPPSLPIEFSPYQATVLRIGDASENYAREIAQELRKAGLARVFIDLSQKRLGEKLREWGMLWTPLIIVIGKKEEDTSSAVLRIRRTGVQLPLRKEEIAEHIARLLSEEQMMRA
ncbi:MAG: threonyl-tRNA synthetase editing domain-containing protein [Fervidicoccaceae archaeon]